MTNELTDLIAEVNAEAHADERGAIDDLLPLWEAKQAIKWYEADVKRIDPSASDYGAMGRVRRYLTDHPDEPLTDQEHRIRARLLPGGTSDLWEPANAIRERKPHVYQRLQELGCLQVDPTAVKNAIAKGHLSAGDVAEFCRQVGKTPRLEVQKLES